MIHQTETAPLFTPCLRLKLIITPDWGTTVRFTNWNNNKLICSQILRRRRFDIIWDKTQGGPHQQNLLILSAISYLTSLKPISYCPPHRPRPSPEDDTPEWKFWKLSLFQSGHSQTERGGQNNDGDDEGWIWGRSMHFPNNRSECIWNWLLATMETEAVKQGQKFKAVWGGRAGG